MDLDEKAEEPGIEWYSFLTLGTLEDDDDILTVWRTRTITENLRREYEKTTDRVGCVNTLMNSLNEVISVTFALSWTNTSTDKKSLYA